jgi:DNA gyrase subunit A
MQREKIVPINVEDEMRDSFIDYSMSVIVSRALPDVRDGLKPVHRRVLFGMSELGLQAGRAYKKSARVVGEVLGKYHPHGDNAVYDTIVRLVQDFSMRYPLIDGQGNFGSIDGDAPAAMRYTEVRLKRITAEMLRDIEKNTVDFQPNFDDSLEEPTVMPSAIPNLLVNGSTGIAVGMATNIPPHNLSEVIDGIIAYIDNRDITIDELMKHIKAPDFPTGGIIYGYDGVKDAYLTGRGKVVIRAKVNIETNEKTDRESIIVTQLPYQVNKARLQEKIAELVNEKKIEGISDVRDESDRDGMRLVIMLKRDAVTQVVLNNLFKHTQMQETFGVIMLALVDGQPRILNLKEVIHYYVKHRHQVVIRRTKFDLAEAEKRAHILEGLKIALDNLDAIIKLIRAAKDGDEAREGLMTKFKLSEIQAKAILDMRLQRLTGLERQKIEDEYREVIKLIEQLNAILSSEKLQYKLIKDELKQVKKEFGDERRTEIVMKAEDFKIEDMIKNEDVVITITHNGFIKRTTVDTYKRQGRGGKGITGAATKDDDFVEHMFIASTHQYILFFTSKGKCYWLKVYEIPEGGRATRGRSLSNLIEFESGETIRAYINVKEFSDSQFVLMATKNGTIKKTPLSEYANPRKTGIIAINIEQGDELIGATLTDGEHQVILAKKSGYAVRFHERDVRPMGRSATGVKGAEVDKEDSVVSLVTTRHTDVTLLTVTDSGYGKRSELEEYRMTKRGAGGVITLKSNEKVGNLVAMLEVKDSDDLIIITSNGIVNRQHVEDIRVMGRATSGVRLIRLEEGDTVSAVARVPKEESDESSENKEE